MPITRLMQRFSSISFGGIATSRTAFIIVISGYDAIVISVVCWTHRTTLHFLSVSNRSRPLTNGSTRKYVSISSPIFTCARSNSDEAFRRSNIVCAHSDSVCEKGNCCSVHCGGGQHSFIVLGSDNLIGLESSDIIPPEIRPIPRTNAIVTFHEKTS